MMSTKLHVERLLIITNSFHTLVMHLDKDKARELWNRYLQGTCSEEEKRFVEHWYNQAFDEEIGLHHTMVRRAGRIRRIKLIAAALAVIALATTLYLYTSQTEEHGPAFSSSIPSNEIMPGENKATLTLSNGQTIDLSSDQEGLISGDRLMYRDGSEVWNEAEVPGDSRSSSPTERIFTLSTPKGGQYHVVLPDGTQVWLNAASTLTYPGAFRKTSREVELTGEAYFQVAKNPEQAAFVVKSAGQRAVVLGTEFNISAYEEEEEIRTTLVQGALKIQAVQVDTDGSGEQSLVLRPREETTWSNGKLTVETVDTQSATAWKNGLFYFNDTPLEDMLRQISRWYNIDIHYESGIPQERFTGKMLRSLTLSEVLDFLKGSDIRFQLKDRTLIIKQPNRKQN